MSDIPVVSVVMPGRNVGKFVDEAIASVLGQTHDSLELVVVDDGSTDDTWKRLQRWESIDPRVRPVRNARSIGVASSRNVGNEVARAEWIALMDSDDLWLPDKLERQLAHLALHPDIDLLGTHFELFFDDPSERFRPVWRHGGIRAGTTPGAQPTFLVRASLFRDHGGFDPSFRLGSDHELFLRLTHHGAHIQMLEEPLVLVRRHGDNITLRRKREQVRNTLRIHYRQLVRYRMGMSAAGYAITFEHLCRYAWIALGLDRAISRRLVHRVLRRDPARVLHPTNAPVPEAE